MLWDLAVGAKKDRRSGARAGVTARRERRSRVGTHETADRSGVVVIRGTIWVWLEEEGWEVVLPKGPEKKKWN